MKWKKWLFAAAVIVTVGLVIVSGWVPSYSAAIEANWGISLPWQAKMQEVYAKDTGASFHGDGLRYHVFEYEHEDYIDLMFAWSANEHETRHYETVSQAAEAWLDEIDVPAEERPVYDRCGSWNRIKNGTDEIIFFCDSEQNRIYVLESFF